ncbi:MULTISPECIES: ABC transporter substrate-binding protein [Hydrogenophaga]|uniref:Periplasmic-binding protein n=1 Tax=Hydrogenophaga intermedia TaxID=65786 RepID=A0A1L1PKC2_HYDIT|nr:MULTISPECIES: helical backbone metal receptor [Hydrogenophaga]AOS79052.1 ABC transporter substrate-binding protein [Hydrogenophaga sp. PBC]TMU74581.1 ABC transporter substrate-binding protein [Hydrogenophaga intermedia]CDN88199.1 Periplasmic-binding protein [Hydrogenophaga intermedia]
MTRLLFSLALGLWLACSGAAQATEIRVTDDRGISVTLPRSPQRIVSLLPSLTETVCELGQCHRLVGVDRYSNHPASVRALPQTGGGVDPNIEAIVALRPDVVLAATSSRGVPRLESFGLKVLALEPRTTRDAQRVMGVLGQVLEVPDADRIWRAIDAGVSAAAQSLPATARSLRVYYEVSNGGYAAGPQSFIGELMDRLGVQNIITPELGPFPRINPEYVVRANPDLIMIGKRNVAGLEQRPGWRGMRALREDRVCVFTADESDVLVRPGPRMAEAARLMAKCITDKGLK